MTATLVTSNLFAFADGNAGHACALGSAPNVGEFDLLGVNSDTVVSTPSGFTIGTSNVNSQGAYFFYRKAVGGESSSVTVTTSGNFNCQVSHSRWSGLNAVDVVAKTSVVGANLSSTPAVSTGTLGGTGELVVAFAALHSMGAPAASAPVWSSGYTAVTGPNPQGGATSSAVDAFVGKKDGAGTASESPSVSWTSGLASDRDILVLVFSGAVSAPTPATVAGVAGVPTAITKVTAAPTTVAGVATVPVPKLAIVVATVAGIASVPAVTTRVVAVPPTVAGVGAIATPTVTTSSDATATPATVAALASVPAPVTSVRAVPATVAGVAGIPTATTRAVATPATVAGVAGVPTPSVSGSSDATTTPATVAGVAAIPAPVVAVRAAPGTVAASAGIPAPIARAAAAPATVAASAAIPAATARAVVTLTTVAVVAAIATPTILAISTPQPPTVAAVAGIPVPAVTGTAGGGGLTASPRAVPSIRVSPRGTPGLSISSRATGTLTGGG